MYENSTSTSALTLDDLNEEHIRQLLAPIVFLVLLLLIGVPGNLTVLVIYGQRYRKSVYRTILWNLAVADMTFCSIGIPFNIARVVNYYTFKGRWTCKIFTSLLIFGIMYSTQLLMLLSFHRFRQICMPLRTQITVRNIKRCIFACFLIGVFLTWPQMALEELEIVQLGNNLTGQVCPITNKDPSVYWIANSIVWLCLFTFYTIVLIVFYSMIGRKIFLQHRRRDRHAEIAITSEHNVTGKMTKIAFTISVVFAVSYIPLFLLKAVKGNFDEEKMNGFEFSTLRLAERLYIVNHVANPFIYAVFDNRFRKQLKGYCSFLLHHRKKQNDLSRSAASTSFTS